MAWYRISTSKYMFFCFLIFIYLFFYFTILYWFCHTSTCIHHRCTCVPHPEPPSHLPPHTIPLGHPSAPAPSFLYPVFLKLEFKKKKKTFGHFKELRRLVLIRAEKGWHFEQGL